MSEYDQELFDALSALDGYKVFFVVPDAGRIVMGIERRHDKTGQLFAGTYAFDRADFEAYDFSYALRQFVDQANGALGLVEDPPPQRPDRTKLGPMIDPVLHPQQKKGFVELLELLLVEEKGYSPEQAKRLIKAYPNVVINGMMASNLNATAIALEISDDEACRG